MKIMISLFSIIEGPMPKSAAKKRKQTLNDLSDEEKKHSHTRGVNCAAPATASAK